MRKFDCCDKPNNVTIPRNSECTMEILSAFWGSPHSQSSPRRVTCSFSYSSEHASHTLGIQANSPFERVSISLKGAINCPRNSDNMLAFC